MKRKITCFCEKSFETEIPEEINLDIESSYLDQILDGSFFNFSCPSCGKNLKPEFRLAVFWPSKNISYDVFTELERGEFYRTKKNAIKPSSSQFPMETLIGYPEMSERIAVLKDGFEPLAIEAIKYFLHIKADEQYPDDELEISYFGFDEQKTLEFHIQGIRQNEVAVMKIPSSLYQKTLEDIKNNPKSEIFKALKISNYLSVKNTMRPEVFL